MIKKHKDNLNKLADYLDALPIDYKHFNMGYFLAVGLERGEGIHCPSIERDIDEASTIDLNECGACACAIGHGPSAGIPVCRDPTWSDYAIRVFGFDFSDDAEGDYMFGSDHPNDPQLAARRIRAVLNGSWQFADRHG